MIRYGLERCVQCFQYFVASNLAAAAVDSGRIRKGCSPVRQVLAQSGRSFRDSVDAVYVLSARGCQLFDSVRFRTNIMNSHFHCSINVSRIL